MKKNFITQKKYNSIEPSPLDWQKVCKEIENKLGKDIYESWIKKLKLIEEFQHYIVLSSPTRFIRDWIVSRYVDKIIAIIKLHKKDLKFVWPKRYRK